MSEVTWGGGGGRAVRLRDGPVAGSGAEEGRRADGAGERSCRSRSQDSRRGLTMSAWRALSRLSGSDVLSAADGCSGRRESRGSLGLFRARI